MTTYIWILLITLTLQNTDNVFEADNVVFSVTSGNVHMQSDTGYASQALCQQAANNLPTTFQGLGYVIEDTNCKKTKVTTPRNR